MEENLLSTRLRTFRLAHVFSKIVRVVNIMSLQLVQIFLVSLDLFLGLLLDLFMGLILTIGKTFLINYSK